MQFHEMVNEYLQRLNAFPLPGARVHVQRHAHGRAGAGHGIFKGLAAILKKGLRLNMVHDLNRPYAEMMLGLESWIPLYMTGQIAPMVSARQAQQRIWASAVLFRRGGDGGRVHRRRFWARTLPLLPGEKRPALLPKAGRRPPANGAAADGHLPRCLRRRVQLVSVCQHARSRRIPRGADRASAAYAVGRMPYAPSEKNGVSSSEQENIRHAFARSRALVAPLMQNSTYEEGFPVLSPSAFEAEAPLLARSGLFCDAELRYDPAGYQEHLRLKRVCSGPSPLHGPGSRAQRVSQPANLDSQGKVGGHFQMQSPCDSFRHPPSQAVRGD